MQRNDTLPIPENEYERLRALKSYQVLDTLPEEDFDALTRLASYICDTPIALISLIDADRQWFKSRVGLDATETPREVAFCQYAIMDDQLYEVPNALQDALFVNNPLVTGPPDIRFYAGAPLTLSSGVNLGTLCVIDTVPRSLTAAQRDALETLAREVVSHLELRRQKVYLEQVNERLHKFAHVAAHDLRAPLRAVGQLAAFIRDDLAQGRIDDTPEHLDLLLARIARMDALIVALLAYSRIGATNRPQEAVDLNAQVAEVIGALDVPERFTVTVQTSLPSIKIDPLRFQQIVQNLVGNAIKHHDKDTGRIEISCEEQGDFFVFCVQDDGPGIAPAYQEKVFEVFQTLKARDEVESTGIGLSIVKRIVEEEGGQLWVESEEGQGAAFHFSLHKT